MENPIFEGQALSRRNVLKALSAAGAAAALPRSELFGQSVYKSTAKGGRIDVHHHHLPPGTSPVPGKGPPPPPGGGPGQSALASWTPAATLEQMDKYDIAVAMLSMTQMGAILYDNTEKGRATVRYGNEYGARLMSEHPQRFGLFTGVPLPDIDGVMKELEYGLDTLKADGIGILHQRQSDAMARRPLLRPDVAGTQPPRHDRVYAPAGCALLHRFKRRSRHRHGRVRF